MVRNIFYSIGRCCTATWLFKDILFNAVSICTVVKGYFAAAAFFISFFFFGVGVGGWVWVYFFFLSLSTGDSALWIFLKRDHPLIKERLQSAFPWEHCSEAMAAAAAGYQSSFTAWPEKAEILLDHLSQ